MMSLKGHKIRCRVGLVLCAFLVFQTSPVWAIGKNTSFTPPQGIYSIPVQRGWMTSLEVNGLLGAHPGGHQGFATAVRLQREFVGLSLSLNYGKAIYGDISAMPDPSDFNGTASSSNFDAEINRARSGSDKWNYWIIEPEIFISGRLSPDLLPLLCERGRFGLGFGHFNDTINSLTFSGTTFSYHFELGLRLGIHSRWILWAGLGHEAGSLLASNGHGESTDRLPISWLSETLALGFSF
ncbi:hypothetical protein WDW37_12435 [Bdellovibrionota bacterium FG-1]